MSQALASLSGKTVAETGQAIAKLEELSGYPSEDVRVLAEANHGLRAKLEQLGLDPDDTTGQELYHALLSRYHQDAGRVDKAIGLSPDSGLAQRVAKASELARQAAGASQVWALKNSAARGLLRDNPPKKLMKKLNYRSLNSLLKHEDIAAIFIEADRLELPTWHKIFASKLAKLGSANYELRAPKIAQLHGERLAGGSDELVAVNESIGAVAVWPPAVNKGTSALSIALFLLDGLESLSEQQTVHQLRAVNPALNWWADTEHLLFANNGQPVSLNFKDVARNHLAGAAYESRVCQNGHQALWARLMSRYKNYLDELPQDVLSAERTVAKQVAPFRELALEPVEALER